MAGRSRLAWAGLPDEIRRGIEERAGSVVTATSHEGGYSPGMAATLTSADGGRLFVKAVSTSFHERSAEMYREEAKVNVVLPETAPAPRMRWSLDDGEWIVLAFDAADSSVRVPWQPADLGAALEAFDQIGRIPAPEGFGSVVDMLSGMPSWRKAADEETDLSSWDPWVAANLPRLVALTDDWPQAAAGDRLSHGDARADNMVRSGGRLLFVDWPFAVGAAAWVDLLGFLPSAELEGAGPAAKIWSEHPLAQAADQEAATKVLAGITGYFVYSSLQPPPPAIPHLRAYQRAQGEVALAWLRDRLGS